jgi:hypothetical protein
MYYNIGIRHKLVSRLRLHLGLVLTGLRGTQLTGSIIYTLVTYSYGFTPSALDDNSLILMKADVRVRLL